MNVLALLASATLAKEWESERPVLKPLFNAQEVARKFLPPEPIAPVISVNQIKSQSENQLKNKLDKQPENPLKNQSINELSNIEPGEDEQNQQWNRVQDLDTPDPDLEGEEQPFSPTAVLEGEIVLGVSGLAGGDRDNSAVLQESVEFILNMSFSGEDRLQIGFESGNAMAFPLVEDELTFEGRPSIPADTEGNRFELSELSYEFPVGDRASLYLSAAGDDLDDFNPFFGDSGNGAISEFGTENPIHSLVEDFGLQLNYDCTDTLSLSLGYFSGDAGNPEPGAGLFNGNHSAFVQLGFAPDDRFLLGLTYVYTHNDASLETETGSLRSQLNLESPVVGNSYGLAASFSPSSRLAIGGWMGFTHATVLDLGTAEVWNYALTLALPDLGGEGNLLGVILGQEPRLTGTSGFVIDDRRRDPDTSLHLEVFYSDRLSDHLSVTPGLIWITAPNHDNNNPDIVVLTVRTTFEF